MVTTEVFSTEIIRTLVGSIGLILAVPASPRRGRDRGHRGTIGLSGGVVLARDDFPDPPEECAPRSCPP